MADQWYYASNRQQMGPVSWNELCRLADSGLLKASDLVWKDGMPDWAQAGGQGLFRREAEAPTALAKPLPARADVDLEPRRVRVPEPEDDDFDDAFDDRPRRKRPSGMPVGAKVGLIVGVALALLVVVGVALFFLLRTSGQPALEVPATGLIINDSLRMSDPRDRAMGFPCKVYYVRLIANSTYVIDQRAPMLDSYLRLEDPAGRQVAADDDGGRGFGGGMLDARIVYTAGQTGTYRIISTSFDGGIGNFLLSVRKK